MATCRLTTLVVLTLLVVILAALVSCSNANAVSGNALATQSAVPTVTAPAVPRTDLAATAATSATVTPGSSGEPSQQQTPPAATSGATWAAGASQVPCGVLLPILASGPQRESLQFDPGEIDLSLPDSARPAFERLLDAPETVGLVAFQVGRESEGIYVNADTPMPLASVVKIINLIAYARAVSEGRLDPAEWIALDEIAQTYLPRSDRGAHNRALQDLEDRQLIAFDPPATPLEEVPWMMIRHSSNAAADYLQLRLGQQAIEQTVIDLGLDSHTAPCPWVGQFLTMANRQTAGDNSSTVRSFIANPDDYGQEVMRLTESYAYDDAFRTRESNPGWRASFDTQLLFSDNLNAQASARDYAALMARIAQNQLGGDYTNILVRRALEWPMLFPVNQEQFTAIGLKDGSLPGVLTTAYYARRIEDGATVVVVLFYRQLPRQTYRQWLNELPNDEFARWLLSDPLAIPQLRAALQRTS